MAFYILVFVAIFFRSDLVHSVHYFAFRQLTYSSKPCRILSFLRNYTWRVTVEIVHDFTTDDHVES